MAEGVHHGHMLEDFFLVCEFCEIYGPRTVLTIPSAVASPNNNELFNLEEFLLNIMTTDYQNFPGWVLFQFKSNNSLDKNLETNSDKWETIADVSCIRTNVLPNLHTILHYFTLKDPNARGSVRPSCVAYITANQVKLYRWKREVMKVLSIAAQLFKQANMQWMQYNGHTVEIPVSNQLICLIHMLNGISPRMTKTFASY